MSDRVVLLKIKSLLPSLSAKEQQIAELILSDTKAVSRMTISEMATKLGVADSTIFKFTKKIGFEGYRDFRNELLSESYDPKISVHENIESTDTPYEVAQKVFESSVKSLNDTMALLTPEDLDTAIDIMMGSSSFSFYGCGGSNVVAMDAYQKFLRSPICCHYETDYHMQLMQVSQLKPGNCAFIVSHTGLTRDTIRIAQLAKGAGAKVIAITSYPSPPLMKYADVALVSAAEETGFRSESLSSRISQLAIFDSLFTAVMFRMPGVSESLYNIRRAIDPTKIE